DPEEAGVRGKAGGCRRAGGAGVRRQRPRGDIDERVDLPRRRGEPRPGVVTRGDGGGHPCGRAPAPPADDALRPAFSPTAEGFFRRAAARRAGQPERQRRPPRAPLPPHPAGPGSGSPGPLAQSVHQSCSMTASPGPVFGAPTAITSAPWRPPSNERIVSFGTRTASHG